MAHEDEAFEALLREVAKAPPRVPPDRDPRIGTRLGRFLVVERLGRGGMGIVYRAIDERLGREIALKVLAEEHPYDAAALVAEARRAASVTHPAIAAVYEVGGDDAQPFFAMELVRGEPLESVFQRGRVPARTAHRIAREFARGLAALHQHGIVHRDLTSTNIILDERGEVKILDFGIALASRIDEVDRFRGAGTRSYAAPEQSSGNPVDARADVFAFGVLLHRLLTGVLPGEAGPRSAKVRGRNRALLALCARCLDPDPARRPAHGDELVHALAEAESRAAVAKWSLVVLGVIAGLVILVTRSTHDSSVSPLEHTVARGSPPLLAPHRVTFNASSAGIRDVLLMPGGERVTLIDPLGLHEISAASGAREHTDAQGRAFQTLGSFGPHGLISVVADAQHSFSVVRIEAGGHVTPLLMAPDAHHVTVSPRLDRVAMLVSDALLLLRLQANEQAFEIEPLEQAATHRVEGWSSMLHRPAWSPDGALVAYARTMLHFKGRRTVIDFVDAEDGTRRASLEDAHAASSLGTSAFVFIGNRALMYAQMEAESAGSTLNIATLEEDGSITITPIGTVPLPILSSLSYDPSRRRAAFLGIDSQADANIIDLGADRPITRTRVTPSDRDEWVDAFADDETIWITRRAGEIYTCDRVEIASGVVRESFSGSEFSPIGLVPAQDGTQLFFRYTHDDPEAAVLARRFPAEGDRVDVLDLAIPRIRSRTRVPTAYSRIVCPARTTHCLVGTPIDEGLAIYTVSDREIERIAVLPGSQHGTMCFTASDDGSRLAVRSDRGIIVYGIDGQELEHIAPMFDDAVWCRAQFVAFASERELIASFVCGGDAGTTFRVTRLAPGHPPEVLWTTPHEWPAGLVVSPDGSRLAMTTIGWDDDVYVVDLPSSFGTTPGHSNLRNRER